MSARVVLPAAYVDTGAAGVPCLHCGAGIGQWCTRPDGGVRRTPCIDRICHLPQPSTAADVDFSEPRRPRGGGAS